MKYQSHWTDVNADRVAGAGTALLFADGYSLAGLTTDVATVAAAITGLPEVPLPFSLPSAGRAGEGGGWSGFAQKM